MVTCDQLADFVWVLCCEHCFLKVGSWEWTEAWCREAYICILTARRRMWQRLFSKGFGVVKQMQVICQWQLGSRCFGNACSICLCRISWRGPVVLVPGTFCLWFQFFRGGCCSRRGNPCVSCCRGNIWIWWINNMNYISKIQTTSLWRNLHAAGGWSWHLKLAENHEDQKPRSKELTGDEAVEVFGGRAREKMLSLLMCWKTLLLQVTTVTTCKHPPKTEPLPFITTILNPWILRSWWWSCWGLWRYGGETSARVWIQHFWHSTPRQLEETRRLHRELVSEAFRQTKARCWSWGQLKESSGSSD